MRTRPVILTLAVALMLLIACDSSRRDWEKASAKNTRQAYTEFIILHPDSRYADEARARLDSIVESIDWSSAAAAGTVEALVSFIENWPESSRREEAQRSIDGFKEAVLAREGNWTGNTSHGGPIKFALRGDHLVGRFIIKGLWINCSLDLPEGVIAVRTMTHDYDFPDVDLPLNVDLEGSFSKDFNVGDDKLLLTGTFDGRGGVDGQIWLVSESGSCAGTTDATWGATKSR